MSITALPSPPSTNDPANFATKADALLAALPAFVTETNATAAAMNLNATTDTSSSSVAIGTGAKSFTVSTGKSFQLGMWLVIADTAAPSTNAMFGSITSYDVATGALVMNITAVIGSGTKTAWTISQSSFGGASAGANSNILSTSALTTMTNLATINGANAAFVPVRQTVLSGPVDTSGNAAFGGSTGAATVTASGTLIATAANGYVAGGQQNRIGSITNPAWTGLSTNGTMYLWLDVNADGTCTTGSGTLIPTYRTGGADVVTANQFTFNVQEMTGKVGNGTTAAQTYRVYVGEVTVAGAVVTDITWYALMARYQSAEQTITAGTPVVLSHNMGIQPTKIVHVIRNRTTEAGYPVGYEIPYPLGNPSSGTAVSTSISADRLVVRMIPGSAANSFLLVVATNGTTGNITNASWRQLAYLDRGW